MCLGTRDIEINVKQDKDGTLELPPRQLMGLIKVDLNGGN